MAVHSSAAPVSVELIVGIEGAGNLVAVPSMAWRGLDLDHLGGSNLRLVVKQHRSPHLHLPHRRTRGQKRCLILYPNPVVQGELVVKISAESSHQTEMMLLLC